MRHLFLLLLLLLGWAGNPASAADCVGCHERETPAAVAQWRGSAHAAVIGCDGCHGSDHERIVAGNAPVEAKVCGRCHQEAYHQHVRSRHGMGLHSGWGCVRNLARRDPRECRFCHEEGSTRPLSTVQCARFLTQSSEMGTIGCNRCHQVESSCASCHNNHLTDLAAVRRPEVCATCHMGPDHPQWEMWQTSRHGVLFATAGEAVGPSCQRCHMPGGSHDVSFGITMTSGMDLLPEAERGGRRAEMLGICRSCHAKGFSERELARNDAVRTQSVALVAQAARTIEQMADRGQLQPSPGERPAHPLRGKELVLDGQMLYENLSRAERLFFKMKKYDLAKAVKGAYHQNPAYTHWYGNAELKLTLAEIQAEAALMESLAGGQDKAAGRSETQTKSQELRLQELRRRFERGAIGADEYEAEKRKVLDAVRDARP